MSTASPRDLQGHDWIGKEKSSQQAANIPCITNNLYPLNSQHRRRRLRLIRIQQILIQATSLDLMLPHAPRPVRRPRHSHPALHRFLRRQVRQSLLLNRLPSISGSGTAISATDRQRRGLYASVGLRVHCLHDGELDGRCYGGEAVVLHQDDCVRGICLGGVGEGLGGGEKGGEVCSDLWSADEEVLVGCDVVGGVVVADVVYWNCVAYTIVNKNRCLLSEGASSIPKKPAICIEALRGTPLNEYGITSGE